MSLLDALVLAYAEWLAGYYIGIGKREVGAKSGNADLEKINSAVERLTKELCGDYKARAVNASMIESGVKHSELMDVASGALDRLASATEGVARNLHDLKQLLNVDASRGNP